MKSIKFLSENKRATITFGVLIACLDIERQTAYGGWKIEQRRVGDTDDILEQFDSLEDWDQADWDTAAQRAVERRAKYNG